MEQAARSSEETDLPVGTGDLLEISVFEVEELSKIRLRVPGRGAIALPLVGQIQAAGRTTAELEEEIRRDNERRYAFYRMLNATDRVLWRLEELNRDGSKTIPADMRMRMRDSLTELPSSCLEIHWARITPTPGSTTRTAWPDVAQSTAEWHM